MVPALLRLASASEPTRLASSNDTLVERPSVHMKHRRVLSTDYATRWLRSAHAEGDGATGYRPTAEALAEQDRTCKTLVDEIVVAFLER